MLLSYQNAITYKGKIVMINTVKRVVLPVAISMLAMSTASYAVVGQGATQLQVQPEQYAAGEVLVLFTDQSSSNSVYSVNMFNTILGENQYTQKTFSNLSSALIQSHGYTTQELIGISINRNWNGLLVRTLWFQNFRAMLFDLPPEIGRIT